MLIIRKIILKRVLIQSENLVKHYIYINNYEDVFHPANNREEYSQEKVGAITWGPKNKYLLYKVDNLLGKDLFYMESYGAYFMKYKDLREAIEYYKNEAPLFASVYALDGHYAVKVEDIDSQRVRDIINKVYNEGNHSNPVDSSEQLADKDDGFIMFYSTDVIDCASVSYEVYDDDLVAEVRGRYLILDGEDEEFIRGLIKEGLNAEAAPHRRKG